MPPSIPAAFADRMRARLGGEWEDMQAALLSPAPVSIRLNPHKPSEAFADAKRIPWHPEGRFLPERPVFALDPLWHAGAYYVQEASSMLIAEALGDYLDTPRRILDMSAAPGGKSTLLAARMAPGSTLVANEVVQSRARILAENIVRWGVPGVLVTQADPEKFAPLAGQFDLVLLDAPCSGEGLWRKDARAVDEWSPEAVQFCADRQRRILAAAAELVRPGGRILYSTCTYANEENGLNVDWFCREFGYRPVELDLARHGLVADDAGGWQAYPHRVRGEGFYLALLERDEKAGLAFSTAGLPKTIRRPAELAQWAR